MSTYYFVGAGIASLAGAVYLIRDAGVDGHDIVILEASDDFGGSLDAHGDSATGYFMSGSRMFESKYRCTFDLLSGIPAGSDRAISVTDETNRVAVEDSWNDKARLVNLDGTIAEFHRLGFCERDRADLLTMLLEPEKILDAKRISDRFEPTFFQTNFWYEWCTLFAFQPWHSAIEFRRYLLRFIHHFSTIDTEAGVYRTHFNQYDSIAVPIVAWLRERGTEIRFSTTVVDLAFMASKNDAITVQAIVCTSAGADATIEVGPSDAVFVTNGSMTADKAFGSNATAPVLDRGKNSGAWRLWETLAWNRPAFGKPEVFNGHIDE